MKNPNAARALLKAIMSTSIYKHAEDFAKVCASKAHCFFVSMLFQCRDTYYIESFHNCLLIYVPKRIHFSDKVYNMQVHLGRYFLQVAGCRLKFHYNWKTAGTKKKGKAIDLP
mgnify:CR=1 FL=1